MQLVQTSISSRLDYCNGLSVYLYAQLPTSSDHWLLSVQCCCVNSMLCLTVTCCHQWHWVSPTCCTIPRQPSTFCCWIYFLTTPTLKTEIRWNKPHLKQHHYINAASISQCCRIAITRHSSGWLPWRPSPASCTEFHRRDQCRWLSHTNPCQSNHTHTHTLGSHVKFHEMKIPGKFSLKLTLKISWLTIDYNIDIEPQLVQSESPTNKLT